MRQGFSARSLYPFPIRGLGGSVDEMTSPTGLAPGDLLACSNFRPHKDGISLIKRKGYTKLDQYYSFSGEVLRAVYDFWDWNRECLIAAATTQKILIRNAAGSAWTLLFNESPGLSKPTKFISFNTEKPIIVGFNKNLYIEPGELYANNILTNGRMELWTGTTDLNSWTESLSGTSTINREDIIKYEGRYACRFDLDASSSAASISQDVVLTPNSKYELSIIYKMSLTGKTAKIRVKNTGGNVSLKSDGTWGAGAENYITLENYTAWKKFSIKFLAHASYSNYTVSFLSASAASSSIYFDDARLRPKSAYQVFQLGIDPPETAPALSEGSTGTLTGTFKYVVTYYRSGNFPCESNPCIASSEITVAAKVIYLSDIPVSTDPQVDTKRIYRTTAGGALFYWLADIDNAETFFVDDFSSLGDPVSNERYVPAPAFCAEVWDDRIWFVPKDYRNQLHFTNKGSGEEMDHRNIIPVRGRDSDIVMAIKEYDGSLYVLKTKRMFRVDKKGESEYELVELPFKTGTDSPCSVAVGGGKPGFMIWKSKRGIEVFNGEGILRPPISDRLKVTMKTINTAQVEKSFGAYNEKHDEYWLSVPTGSATEPDLIVCLDVMTGKLWTFKFSNNMTCMHNVRDADQEYKFLTGSSNSHLFVHDSSFTDDGVAIIAAAKTGHVFCQPDALGTWNTLRRLFQQYICPAGTSITLKIYINEKSAYAVSMALAGATPSPDTFDRRVITARRNLGQSCHYFQLEYSHGGATAPTDDVRIFPPLLYFKNRVWKGDVKGN